jgi:hypothetical protein
MLAANRTPGRKGRARGVPDPVVIRGESRSPADTPQALSPAETEIRAPGLRSLQAGVRGSSPLSSTRQNTSPLDRQVAFDTRS